mmetsp:Transcript_1642/g.4047  ORF Transcript_1642/g.4047 Transcript_1642/m.4047 type:complete len:430 (+) Transcript_1642:1975-3264(+)
MPGLMRCVASAATLDLELPMFQSLNRNWRDRLLFSMVSSSVTVSTPLSFGPVAMPIMAKFLRNSQPRAPAPTRNNFTPSSLRCIVRPNTAICASYLEPTGANSSAGSFSRSGSDSKLSKCSHWCRGWNLPDTAFTTSWPTMPPNMAAMGLSSPEAQWASVRSTLSVSSPARTDSGMVSLMPLASCSRRFASSALAGRGAWPFSASKAFRASMPTWMRGGRSNLAKSRSRNSPGSGTAASNVLNFRSLGSLNWVTRPPRWYCLKDEVSRSSSNECALQFLTLMGLCVLSSVMPSTSVNITSSPSWNCRRSSSTQVTTAGLLLLMEATMAVWGSSPSTSKTVNLGPKSLNTLANTPLDCAQMNLMPWAWHRASTRLASSRLASVSTATWNCFRKLASRSAAEEHTFTAVFSSCSLSLQASARFLPTSSSFR